MHLLVQQQRAGTPAHTFSGSGSYGELMISDRPHVKSCHPCAPVPVRPQPKHVQTLSDPLGPHLDPLGHSRDPQGPLPEVGQRSGIYTGKKWYLVCEKNFD